jgi:hypothetical protein
MKAKITIVIAFLLSLVILITLLGAYSEFYFDIEYLYFLLPLFIGPFIFLKYRKYKVAKCIGILSIKPIFSPLFLIGMSNFSEELFNHYPYNIVRAILWLLPELFLTIVIVYLFRAEIQKEKSVSLFLFGDMIRWISVFVLLCLPDPNPEPFFYPQLYILVFFAVLFPSIYAVSGYFIVRKHASA